MNFAVVSSVGIKRVDCITITFYLVLKPKSFVGNSPGLLTKNDSVISFNFQKKQIIMIHHNMNRNRTVL